VAGAQLLDLKRRIKSIRNTQKITKAMGLVATAKFKKLRTRNEKIKPYYNAYVEALDKLLGSENLSENPYFRINESDTDLYVVVTSDSGLCGSYNTNVINAALQHMHGKKVKLITVGEKGRHFFKSHEYETVAEFVELGDTPEYKELYEITGAFSNEFLSGNAANVYLVYTEFISPVKQNVRIDKILPLSSVEAEQKDDQYLIEPSKEEVFDYIIDKYLNTTMYHAMVNSIASEYAIKMAAMDNATKNATELLDNLQVKYNRARQSSITQEITEIVGGAEALKG
jgi:F-type H+-transporting ATPase subunit gamma